MNKIWIRFEAITTGIKQKIRSLMQQLRVETSRSKPKIDVESNLRAKEKEVEGYSAEIDKLRANIRGLDNDLKRWNKTSSEYTASITATKKQLREKQQWLKNARKEVRSLKWEDLPWYFQNFSKSLSETIKRIGLFTLAFTAINQVKNVFWWATRTAIEFESSLAWVNKTVELTSQELRGMDNELKRLSTQIPATYQELAKIAELWGQLWVPAEQISQFTETMAQLRATTNLTSDDAIINFAKFNNVVWVTWDEISKVGSVLVELGNNSATTESQILTFGRRIAASWKLAWLTASEILWVGAAFSSAGIEAESWGTAVQKVLLSIANAVREWGSNLELYAKTAWRTSEDFAKYWKEDAGNALADFVSGLQEAWDRSFDILWQLWEDNVRTVRAFLSTANSSQTLANAVNLANNEFANTNALLDEFEVRANTTESKLKIQRNQWALLGETLWTKVAPWLVWIQDIAIKVVWWIPILLELLFVKVYNMIDTFVVRAKNSLVDVTSFIKDIWDAALIWLANLTWDELTAQYIANENIKRKEAEKTRKEYLTWEFERTKQVYNNLKKWLSDELNLITWQETAKRQFIEDEIANEKAKTDEFKSLYDELIDNETETEKEWASEKEKIQDEEQKRLEDDLKKRQDFLDNFYEYDVNKNKESSQRKIDFTQEALDKVLDKIKTARWEELEYYIETANQYKEIIESNTEVVEEAAEKEEDFIKSVYESIQDKNKEAQDWIKELQDEMNKLQDFQEDSSTKIAERQLEIEEERLEVIEKINDLEREWASLQAAQWIWLDTLKSVWEWEVWGWYDVKSLIEILEAQNELNKLDKELAINQDNVNEWILEQVRNYEESSKTEQLLLDQKEEEKELLADIEWGYKSIDEAIKWIREQQEAQQDELEANSRIAEQLQKKYTNIVWEETAKQWEYIDTYTQKVIRLIQKQRELNSLTNSSQTSSSSGNSNNSNVSTTNNININWASNPYDTGRQVAKVTQAWARGSVVSNNS